MFRLRSPVIDRGFGALARQRVVAPATGKVSGRLDGGR